MSYASFYTPETTAFPLDANSLCYVIKRAKKERAPTVVPVMLVTVCRSNININQT